jgi:PIN domain nuclease of toxin-antitoxin system
LSDQSIFTGEPTSPPAAVVAPVTTPVIPPEVAEYVGAGKKYASVEEAIKSVPHAQKHILTLTEELAATKAELDKRRTTEALLDELRTSGVQAQPTAPVSSVTTEEVEKLIQRTISQNEIQTKALVNTETVKSNFIAKFGEQAEAVYIQVAQESGLSLADINRLSASSPNAVLKLAGINTKQVVPVISKPTSTINTAALETNKADPTLSARVKPGASTKDLLSAWKVAGQKIGKQS